jgi:DNA-binding CsgD family transcriptional regulator
MGMKTNSESISYQGTEFLESVVRAIGRLQQSGASPVRRMQMLVQEFCGLFSACAGMGGVVEIDRCSQACTPIVVVHHGWADQKKADLARMSLRPLLSSNPLTAIAFDSLRCNENNAVLVRSQLISDDVWLRSDFGVGVGGALGIRDIAKSIVRTGDGTTGDIYSVVNLYRVARNNFTLDEAQRLHVVHRQLGWVFGDFTKSPVSIVQELPARERETLEQLLLGQSEKQVAYQLGRSRHTVHSYVKRLYRRLGVSSRAELLALFVEKNAGAGEVPTPVDDPK